jgi:TPR repeat protein
MTRRLPALLLTVLLACAPAAPLHAAPGLPPAIQSQVDRAVLDYESGRLAEAREAFTRLAARGVPAAEYNLGVMHLRGETPRASLAEAARLIERAALGGFITAQLMMGRGLETGAFGSAPDIAKAVGWYEVAARNGSPEAQVELATAYYLGRGKPRDNGEAARWFLEAAKAGDPSAQYLLASMYEKGEGLTCDLRLARYWYNAAATSGDAAAALKVREIDAKLAAEPC